jgi:hypothetical protein
MLVCAILCCFDTFIFSWYLDIKAFFPKKYKKGRWTLLEYCIGCVGLQPHLGCSPLGFGEALGLRLPLAAATTNPNGLSQPIRVRVGGGTAFPSCYLPQPPPLCAAGPRGVLPPYKRTPPYAIQIIHCTAIYSLPLTRSDMLF